MDLSPEDYSLGDTSPGTNNRGINFINRPGIRYPNIYWRQDTSRATADKTRMFTYVGGIDQRCST